MNVKELNAGKEKMRVFIDLETEPLPLLEMYMPEFQPAGNLKDPEKIKANIEEKKQEWLSKAALHAVSGRILAVTWAIDNGPVLFSDKSEKELIQDLMMILSIQINKEQPVYAWNGSGFDYLFLCQRAAVHRIPAFKVLTTSFRGRRYWNENLIDPKAIWSMYSSDYRETSLGKVALALGVGQKTGNGANFAELLKTDRDNAIAYAKNDCVLLRGIVEAMAI